MSTVNVRVIHPTNNSDVDLGLPENILLKDVWSQLIDANFLSSGVQYTGLLKAKTDGTRNENLNLDNEKTIAQNGILNNDTVQALNTTPAGISQAI